MFGDSVWGGDREAGQSGGGEPPSNSGGFPGDSPPGFGVFFLRIIGEKRFRNIVGDVVAAGGGGGGRTGTARGCGGGMSWSDVALANPDGAGGIAVSLNFIFSTCRSIDPSNCSFVISVSLMHCLLLGGVRECDDFSREWEEWSLRGVRIDILLAAQRKNDGDSSDEEYAGEGGGRGSSMFCLQNSAAAMLSPGSILVSSFSSASIIGSSSTRLLSLSNSFSANIESFSSTLDPFSLETSAVNLSASSVDCFESIAFCPELEVAIRASIAVEPRPKVEVLIPWTSMLEIRCPMFLA
mmetsp:Transcript_23195/g.53840  ORF Transcript_23195/g.53840 Transcript_23195/m.53840 type:complete len:296 (-) Transcript_23195:153-1040(-)